MDCLVSRIPWIPGLWKPVYKQYYFVATVTNFSKCLIYQTNPYNSQYLQKLLAYADTILEAIISIYATAIFLLKNKQEHMVG